MPFVPDVAIFKTVWVLLAAAVDVEDKFTRLPVVSDEVLISSPFPVVKELATTCIPAVAAVPVVTPVENINGLEPNVSVFVPVAVPPEASDQ